MIYIYIYIYRERERERESVSVHEFMCVIGFCFQYHSYNSHRL